jgi:hypothetical protein
MTLRQDLGLLTKNSYQSQKDAKKNLKQYGYDYDDELSRMDTKVFVKDGKPIIVHRGSKTLRDWADDALLGVGLEKYSKRFQDAKKITKAVEAKYKTGADTVGHSLGGSLAEKSGAKGNIITYNKGAGLGDIGRTKNSKRQIDVRADGDIVSILNKTQKANKETIKNQNKSNKFFKNAFNAHKTDNLFNPPDKSNLLKPDEVNLETDLFESSET